MKASDGSSVPLRGVISLILAVGLGLSWIFTMFGFIADRYLFQPEGYISALERYQFAELLPRLLAEQIVQTEPPDDPTIDPPGRIVQPASQIKYLNVDDYETIMRGLLPAQWVREQTASVITQAFDVLNLRTDRVALRVSLAEVKANLSGPQGDEIVLRVIRSWPACSIEWLALVTTQGLSGELEGFPTCQLPEQFLTLIQPIVRSSLTATADSLPDQMDLVQVSRLIRAGDFRFDQIPPAGDINQGPVLPVSYQILRWFIRLSPLVTLWLLVMLGLFAVRGWRDAAVWLGWPTLVAGIVTLLISLFAGLPLFNAISRQTLDRASGVVTTNLAQVLLLAAEMVAQRYFLWVGIAAALLSLAAAALLAAHYFYRKN